MSTRAKVLVAVGLLFLGSCRFVIDTGGLGGGDAGPDMIDGGAEIDAMLSDALMLECARTSLHVDVESIQPRGELVFEDGDFTINTDDTGSITPSPGEVTMVVRSSMLTGPDLMVISASRLEVAKGTTVRVIGERPLMFVSFGRIDVDGMIDARSTLADGAGAGIGVDAMCPGSMDGQTTASDGGGGGGGYQTEGGEGGSAPNGMGGGKGTTSDSPQSIRAGCSGGKGGNGGGNGGRGGGAVYLFSCGSISINPTGRVSASGSGGNTGTSVGEGVGGGGGGSGGYVGLDGSTVVIQSEAYVTATGGGGGAGGNDLVIEVGAAGGDGAHDTAAPGSGGMAVSPNGSGGDGAFFAGDALPGDSADMGGGGGGGGGGNGFVVIRSDEPFKPLGGIIMPDPTELQP